VLVSECVSVCVCVRERVSVYVLCVCVRERVCIYVCECVLVKILHDD
jgi:hypothetical protein